MNSQLNVVGKNNNEINVLSKEIDMMIKKIDESKKTKIILVGPRASGKTMLINKYKNFHQTIKDLVIVPNFNDLSSFAITTEEKFLEVELILCEELLKYIYNKNLVEFYRKIMSNYKEELSNRYILKLYADNDRIYFNKGCLLKLMLNEIRKEKVYQNMILILDRFDWIKNSSLIYQNILIEFISFFTKTIIVSEDETILNDFRKSELEKKEYDIVSLNFSRNISILREIIISKLKLDKCISINVNKLLEENIIKYLIELSDGNLDIIFYLVDKFNNNIMFNEEQMIELLKEYANEKKQIYKIICKKKLQI